MTVFEKQNIIESVAAYVRVSTQEQKLHGLSLDAQKMKLEEYAKENNMKIVGWYVDEGVSGRKKIARRPELQRMIQDAEKGKFDRIIFIKLDRFFRSVAEYHECMKRIEPVLWTATEEQYNLTTANGRLLVNMKLTIAELEADQTGERIDLTNDYKVSTGQPLTGKMQIPWIICTDKETGRKKIVRNPETEQAITGAIDYCLKHQSKRKVVSYLKAKHNIDIAYNSVARILANPMLYGAYRDNPAYCEPYIDKDTFDRLQEIGKRNIKNNTAGNRSYLFSGMIKCPECNFTLAGCTQHRKTTAGNVLPYKKYRCDNQRKNSRCTFVKYISENVLERMLLADLEKHLENAKISAANVLDAEDNGMKQFDIDEINEQIERLNYSWRTGKIKKVEQYEKDFAELTEKLEAAEREHNTVEVKDFSKIEKILEGGWREVYNSLDDEHKRSFWRSVIQSIEINWNDTKKEITRVNFF
ncbi:MAG: recombinase family protein [Oscillospiraceae bacterium]|nr:recombinase family protein [Oscillospiraceae bacterium]